MKIEQHKNRVRIDFSYEAIEINLDDANIVISREQAYSLFEWLYERRDWLAGKDEQPRVIPLRYDVRDFTQERYQEFVDSLSAETREEIATWKEVIAEERVVSDDWKAIEEQAKRDLEHITSDQDAYAFIDKYLSKELRWRYHKIYRSDRHEMNRTPRQAIDNLLSLPPL